MTRPVTRTADRKPEGVDFGDTMARLETPPTGTPLRVADIFSIRLAVFDKKAPRVEIWSTDINPATVIYDTYQLDYRWDQDTTGYNFRHYLARDLVFSGAIQEAGGHTYRLEYYIVTKNSAGLGRILVAREVYCVPTYSSLPPADTGGGGGNNPDFALTSFPSSQNVNAGSATFFTITDIGSNGFVGTVDLAVTSPPITGVTFSFIQSSIPNDSSTTLNVLTDLTTVPTTYAITVTGTSGALVHTTTMQIVVGAAVGDFSLTCDPTSITIEQGHSGSVIVNSQAINGFAGTIALTALPVISGVTYSFNPTSIIAGNASTLTITIGASSPTGGYTIETTGTSGALVHVTDTSLQLDPSGSGSSGWTTFIASTEVGFVTRKVYVSAAGNDANSGLDDTHPKLTIAGAVSLIRDGFPDWLLLRSGDTFTGRLVDGTTNGGGDYWTKSGRSAANKMLISTYTTGNAALTTFGARAKIDVASPGPPHNLAALQTYNHVIAGNAFPYTSCIALVNLDVGASAFTGLQDYRNIAFIGGGQDILIEGCYFHDGLAGVALGSDGLGAAGILTNVNIRRNIFNNNYSVPAGSSGAQGLYISDTNGCLVEQNCLDSNGWSTERPASQPNQFRRNVYVQNKCIGIVFRNNIVALTDGIQLRPGGNCLGNLFYQNAINLQVGAGNDTEPDGVSGLIKGNVIIDGRDLDMPADPRGVGLLAGNCKGALLNPATWSYNIVVNQTTGTFPGPLILNFDNGHGNPNGMQNCVFDHNIFWNWAGQQRNSLVGWYFTQSFPNGYPLLNITFSFNDFSDQIASDISNHFPLIDYISTTINLPPEIHSSHNRYCKLGVPPTEGTLFRVSGNFYDFTSYGILVGDSTSTYSAVLPTYPNPNASIATYDQSIGGPGTVTHFFTQARLNSKVAWVDAYTAAPVCAHVQAGFGMTVP